ncbi:hypothetical protein IW15_00305 [Chryseobacterium soli]|uniref:Uncharacterized protein n=1 Tax=Chryseobacterium soli TaxID=445961 RepID=A0A086AB66_9FLAO|nr:hypothetical protein [Chryseobacterium soli]KFF13930.1 hypothetical protein IW15_00305 [Chryseobacterium soli]
MHKFLLVFLMSFLSAQQSYKLSYSNSPLSEKGKIVFKIKNIKDERIKVPKQYPSIWARPITIQVYNDEKKEYESTNYVSDDIDCFNTDGCFGKMTYLKKNQSREYEVEIIPGRISRAFKEKKKYRFKLSFDTYAFSGCNDFVTDWLYYQN